MAPRTSWGVLEKYSTLHDKAAALTYAFAKCQACIDGNKRVALIVVRAFLYINGMRFQTAPGELAGMILMVAETDPADREDVTRQLGGWMLDRIVEEETTS